MEETTPQDIPAPMDVEVQELGDVRDKELEMTASVPNTAREIRTTTPSSFASSIQTLTDNALHFLAHASNETLGACLVGFGATTYFVFGRVGLLAIGLAGGVVLHATWDGIRTDDRTDEIKKAERDRRREAGIEVAKRVLEWRSQRSVNDDHEQGRVYAADSQLDYSAFDPKTCQALTTFTDAFIKDYVFYWYGWSLPGELNFPNSARRTFTAFMLSLANHLQRKRPADAFLDFTTNASSIMIVFLNELAAALSASPNTQPEQAIDTYLELKPDTTLSYLLDQDAQNVKLKDISEDILQAYLDPKAYNFPTARVFCKEVLAQLILGYTVTTCSRPEWINEWIVYLFEESETAKEVMEIVDAGVEGRAEPVKDEAPPEAAEEHRKKMDKAEEAVDEAMQEAKRLTQLMIEEDERRAREEQQQQQQQQHHTRVNSTGDVSERSHTQGAPTPTSSQSDRDGHDLEHEAAWGSQTSISDGFAAAKDAHDTDERPSTPNASEQQFLSFDQILPSAHPTALAEDWRAANPIPTNTAPQALTLLNATILIFDDSIPGEKASIKAKPQTDYLIQIEPASSFFPGWMIARKYADFEALHEVLRRISVITGVTGFAETHAEFPKWKQNTKATLRSELEVYLTDAVKYQPLADSEGMKRFLEKDQQISKHAGTRGSGGALGWKLGDDMMSALSKAPKQVAGGGKAVLGGVAGGGKAVFGGVAGLVGAAGVGTGAAKKPASINRTVSSSTTEGLHKSQPSVTTLNGSVSSKDLASPSQDSLSTHSAKPSIDRQSSITSFDSALRPLPPLPPSGTEEDRVEPASPSSGIAASPSRASVEEVMNLPPRPSEMPEDYGTPGKPTSRTSAEILTTNLTRDSTSFDSPDSPRPPIPPRPTSLKSNSRPKKEPLTDTETSVAIELFFAVITELYTLSSAWNFRRTLLSAARTYLLRPGNQHLSAIRDLLQSSLIDSNLTDEGVAAHIYKLRENALPTAEELEQWKIDYPEKSAEEKEALRLKARKLLVSKGMPVALQSVMGAAASGEALGKVFDCLQVERVSRGLIFGLMVQALKVVTQ